MGTTEGVCGVHFGVMEKSDERPLEAAVQRSHIRVAQYAHKKDSNHLR